MNKKYYIKVKDLMQQQNIDLPRPRSKIPIISVTVPVWSDLNVRL